MIGIPGEEREGGTKNVFEEIIAGNFPNRGRKTEIQIQKTQKSPKKFNPRRSTPRHIVIKMAKVVIRIL